MAKDERKIRGLMFGIGDFDSVDPEAALGTEVDFSVGFDEMFDRAVTTAREQKEEFVRDGPCDIEDQCVVILPQGAFHCPIRTMCEGMGINPPEAIAVSMVALAERMGQPIAVLVLIETVYRIKAQGERKPERGELAEAWHAGTDINIKEALTVVVATPLRVAVEFMPYHYGDGSVMWDEGSRRELGSNEGWPVAEVDDGTGVTEAVRAAFSKKGGGPDGPE
jgi:hypothetical protein